MKKNDRGGPHLLGGDDGPPTRWGLEIKAEKHWKMYMGFACTPGAAMYGKLMVYVQFISATDDGGCSSSAVDVNLTITAAPSTGPSQPMDVQPGYWFTVVDLSEHVKGLTEVLDSEDDGHSSESSSSDEEGAGLSQRAVAAPMDPYFLHTMTITNEFHSVSGL